MIAIGECLLSNGIAGIFLVLGFIAIKSGNPKRPLK